MAAKKGRSKWSKTKKTRSVMYATSMREESQPDMTIATMPQAVRMRAVASADDSFAAGEILMRFVGDEPWKLDELVPGGLTFNAVEIAEDGTAATFDVYDVDAWDEPEVRPVARVVVRR